MLNLQEELKTGTQPHFYFINKRKWIFCWSPAKAEKFILPVTGFFMLDIRVRIDVSFFTMDIMVRVMSPRSQRTVEGGYD